MEILTGVIVSIVAQLCKKYFATEEYMTLAIVGVLALIGAYVFTVLQATGYWQTVLSVITTAGAFYAFIIARFPKTN